MDVLQALVNNSLLLLVTVLIYGEIDLRMPTYTTSKAAKNIILGILIGLIGILIIRNPWDTGTGVIYDTRTILMTISGVFFGFIPTMFGALIASVYRIQVGGIGVYAGVLSIFSSAIFGILWGEFRKNRTFKSQLLEFYIVGFISSLFMLLSQLAIPWPASFNLLKQISFPVLLIYPIVTMLICIAIRNKEKRAKQEIHIRNSEALLKASIEGPDDVIVICLDTNFRYLYYNLAHQKSVIKQHGVEIRKGMSFLSIFRQEDDRRTAEKGLLRALEGERFQSITFYGPRDKRVYLETYFSPIIDERDTIIGVTTVSLDITEKIQAMHQLENSERSIRLLMENMQLGVAVHKMIVDEKDNPIDYEFVDVNPKFEADMGLLKEDIVGKRASEVFKELDESLIERFGNVAMTGKPDHFESHFKEVNKIFSLNAFCTEDQHFAVVIEDITDKKKYEDQILFLSYHDFLTGLNNRRAYERDLEVYKSNKYYPLSLVMADINGLKLTNDAFGHHTGDIIIQKVSAILQKQVQFGESLSRIGGDEFVLLLPNTTKEKAQSRIQIMQQGLRNILIESIEVSVSFGLATQNSPKQSVKELLPIAEKDMYTNKLYQISSNRSKTVATILNTLYLKNPREERHSKRVSSLCEAMGKAYKMRPEDVSILKTMGNLHDIGKIAIDSAILDKPGQLTAKEYDEIKRHPEIGYRILSTVNEYSELANDILCHHEHYDGSGYPKGLQGENIPLRARIISVCDAFDAMTSYRTYRKILTRDEAKEELIRCKGIQFDPEVVDVFIQKVMPTLPSMRMVNEKK